MLKTLLVLSPTKVSFHFGEKQISLPDASKTYSNFEELARFLATLDRHSACRGIRNAEFVNLTATKRSPVSKDGEVLRSDSCSYVASVNSRNGLCGSCYKTLRNLERRTQDKTNANKIDILKRKLANANKQVLRMKSRETVLLVLIVIYHKPIY